MAPLQTDSRRAATRWARFKGRDARGRFGRVDKDRIAEYAGDMFDGAAPTGEVFWLDEVELLAPCEPSKIVALWNNFGALAAKLGKTPPAHPLFLIKPASSVAAPGAEIIRPSFYAGKIAYEGELGIVIGRTCKDAGPEDAERSIFGYTCVNDVTAAELLDEDPNFAQWTRAKGCDTFGCVGPAIACGFDWANARVVTRLDGVERQNYPISDMIFTPAEIVSRVSRDMTLMRGDVIACGTSLGVGSIKDGSTVEVSIEGIGALRNTLRGKS